MSIAPNAPLGERAILRHCGYTRSNQLPNSPAPSRIYVRPDSNNEPALDTNQNEKIRTAINRLHTKIIDRPRTGRALRCSALVESRPAVVHRHLNPRISVV